MNHRSIRASHLLAEMRREPRKSWTTGKVRDLYAALGLGEQRSTARHDLQHLAARGRLVESGPENCRVYRLNGAPGR
ncbi:hypothetical protein [Streptomyces noursei]|uniref:hypothetical protein n=1 Tax=Streptomyces noursei TaxID=1971 RepID=UPI0016754B44|nr:hypothetical protein [Streptomyces noursei]MCZ1014037.1 hypothetical protein [Streptomyces noursei]GGX49359.1 hypothetical protein GCM10010341_83780 [Streptomyces noursei]